jgi:glycosyltransferase involved in cell wall biosynthesis
MHKIALISHDSSQSGILRYSLSLFKALRRFPENVDLIVTPTTYIKSPSFELLKPLYGATIYTSIRLFAASLQQDAHIYHLLNATISGYFKLNKLIVTVHDLMPFTLFKERASSWAHMGWLFTYGVQRSMRTGLVNAERIICTSENTKNDLLGSIDVDPKKIRIVYYGVHHELFKPRDKLEARRRLGLPLDRPIILDVAARFFRREVFIKVNPQKGIKQLSPIRPAFIRHWKEFARHPILTLGFIVYQSVRYFSAGLGFLVSKVRK